MAELDLLIDPDAAVTIGLAGRLRETNSALAGVAAGQILLRLAIRTLDVRSVVQDALRQLRFLSSATLARVAGRDVAELRLDPCEEPIAPENVILIAHAVVAATTAMVAAGRSMLIPFAGWRGDLPLDASFDELRADLDDPRIVSWRRLHLAAGGGRKRDLGPACHGGVGILFARKINPR